MKKDIALHEPDRQIAALSTGLAKPLLGCTNLQGRSW
jgi:hypothetical protein